MRSRALLALLVFLPAADVRSGDGDVRLLTDDAIPRYLSRGVELARAQQWDKMVDVLQRVITGDPKVFPDLKPEVLHAAVHSDDGQIYYPARELCLQELAKLPPEGLAAYRAAYDPAARELFEAAEAAEDLRTRLAGYARVYDDYLVSSFGDDALEAAAHLNLYLGRFYEALALYRRLIDVYPNDTDRNLAEALCRAAYCATRIGDREHRDVLLERLTSEHARAKLLIEGKTVLGRDAATHEAFRIGAGGNSLSDTDWPVAGGNAARSRVAADLPDELPAKPFWSFELSRRAPRLEASFGRWQVLYHDREPATDPSSNFDHNMVRPYPAMRPVAAGGVVYYKDYAELVARRLGSGAFVALGRYHWPDGDLTTHEQDATFLYPVEGVRPGTTNNPKDAAQLEEIYRTVDYGGNSVAIDGNFAAVVEASSPPLHLRPGSPPGGARRNRLVVYDRRSGKTLWAWQQDLPAEAVRRSEEVHQDWQEDFQAHQFPNFAGPGVFAGGLLYTIARESDGLAGVSLWAFDRDDGRVRFRTQLHYLDEISAQLPVGASVAVAGGVVYVTTNSGIVAAVDALPPGRVRWIRRYGRNYAAGEANRRRGRNVPVRKRGRIFPGFAYGDPLVTAGKIIVAPPDGKSVFALDAETGRVVWSKSKLALGDVYYVVGASNGIVVLAGDKALGLDVARGEVAWGPVKLEGWPHGRGFVGRKYVYLPVESPMENRSAIQRIDVVTGDAGGLLRCEVPKLGNLLAVDGRLIVANDERIMCFTTYEAERARVDAALERTGERADLLLERALLALRHSPEPKRLAARADLGRALELAVAEKRDPRDIRVIALENLFSLARTTTDAGALDEADAIVRALDEEEKESALRSGQRTYAAQIALLRADQLGRAGRADESVAALEKFLDEFSDVAVLAMRGADVSGWRVATAPDAAQLVREGLLASTDYRKAFDRAVRRRIDEAIAAKDKAALAAIPVRYARRSPTEESYFALAALFLEEGNPANAELTLRKLVRDFPQHPRRAEAHLQLARILAAAELPVEARREREEGMTRLTAADRERVAGLVAELEKLLQEPARVQILGSVAIPVGKFPHSERRGTVVPLAGEAPAGLEGIVLLATHEGYAAIDGDNQLLWRQPYAPGEEVAADPDGDPGTNVVSAAIAAHRYALFADGDLVVGDVYGIARFDARTGAPRWRKPAGGAQRMLRDLAADLRVLERTGDLNRQARLPVFAHSGKTFVRVHPLRGVEAFHLETGAPLWKDERTRQAAVGAPHIVGQLVAVGWAAPGAVRVYNLADGSVVRSFPITNAEGEPGVLLSRPLLDPLGRLLLVVAHDAAATSGGLLIVNARDGNSAHGLEYPVHSPYASVVYADGQLVVFHDGSAAGRNLHFIDLTKEAEEARSSLQTGGLLREVHAIRDGYRLFVFSYKFGLADEGAHLFRVDLKARDALAYELQPRARAYARPVLTQRYVVIAGGGSRGALVQFYDREASNETRHPQQVFRAEDGSLGARIDFPAGETIHYGVAPALSVTGGGIAVSTPFWTGRLHARRGGEEGK